MSATHISSACAAGENWQSVAEACLDALDTGQVPASLGLLYVTEPLAPYIADLHEYLRDKTGVQDWVGTVGGGICGTGRALYAEPAASIMLVTLPDDCYRLIPSGIDAMSDMLARNRSWITERSAHFAIVHGDPRDNRVPQIIDSLSHDLDPGFS